LDALVTLVTQVWQTGDLPTCVPWLTLCLIPKGNDSTAFHGIALLEIIWKLISSIINQRVMNNVQFHDSLHGFCRGRGTQTATIETKLSHQLADMAQTPLFQIFLDLRKAYDSVDRPRMLEIMEACGM
jgi:hypothetical protein